jgi:hypothetical protein
MFANHSFGLGRSSEANLRYTIAEIVRKVHRVADHLRDRSHWFLACVVPFRTKSSINASALHRRQAAIIGTLTPGSLNSWLCCEGSLPHDLLGELAVSKACSTTARYTNSSVSVQHDTVQSFVITHEKPALHYGDASVCGLLTGMVQSAFRTLATSAPMPEGALPVSTPERPLWS